MSLAEDLLNSLPEDQPAVASADPATEPHIVINADKTITIPEALQRILVQHEHNIETVTFDCPRYWDGHDLSQMGLQIVFQRSDGHKEPHPVENLRVDEPNDRMIHFDWTISGNTTFTSGNVKITVCAKLTNAEGVSEREWHTIPNQDLFVNEGMDCSGEEIVERNPDVIEYILAELDELKNTTPANPSAPSPDSGQNVYNVRTYGAIGDGTTDDTDAIAAAIAALPTGGTLYFPAGTYMVDNVFAKSDMTIQGDGWGSVIKLLPARTNYHGRNSCINIEGVERVIVRDIKLDGDRATQQATAAAQDARLNGLFITSAKDVCIENVWMYNNGYHGCIMVGVENVTFSRCRSSFNGFRPIHGHTEIYNVRVSNCICEDNGKGLTGGSGFENDAVFFFGVQRLTINDNIVRSNRRGCICVGADHSSVTTGTIIPSGSISITGNVCECYEDLPYVPTAESDTGVAKFSSQGIVVYGSDGEMRNVTVSGNTIKNAHEAIYLYASDNLVTSLNAAVTGNTIIDCSIGVKAVEVADITITGNQFRNLAEQMMYAQSVERLLVSGNNVYAPGTSEYRLCRVHGSSNVVITGNQFVCPARIAVYAPDSNANVVITNNVMLGFADENPITNTNGVTQNNIIGKTAVEPEPDDGGDTGDGDYPDDSDVETEKVYAGAYENAGFVRLNLASPNTGSVAYVHTTPIPMTDADTRYELNTYVPINDEGVEPEGYTGIGADKEPSIVFLSGDDHMTDAVGIVPMFTRTNGTWSYNANNFITNATNRIFGFTISISAKKVRELFPTATHVMFQVEKSSDPDAVSSVTFGPLGDGKSYVYRTVTE